MNDEDKTIYGNKIRYQRELKKGKGWNGTVKMKLNILKMMP
jgi:hypothetical protein